MRVCGFGICAVLGHICRNEYLAIDGVGNESEYSSRVIVAWLECFPEKSNWCRNEQVCRRVKSAFQCTEYCTI